MSLTSIARACPCFHESHSPSRSATLSQAFRIILRVGPSWPASCNGQTPSVWHFNNSALDARGQFMCPTAFWRESVGCQCGCS